MKKYIKVPMIMQMEALECGAACLAMVLAYYGKWVSLEQLRSDCGVSRDGAHAKDILVAARSYGLTAKGYRSVADQLCDLTVPSVLLWNNTHFVVFCGMKGKQAVINDPARGTVLISKEKLSENFSFISLQMEPTEAFQKGGKPKSVWAFAKHKLKGTLVPFLFVVITGVIASLIGIVVPVFSRIFLDRLLTGLNLNWLYPFMLAFAGIALLQIIVSAIREVYSLKMNGKLAIVASSSFIWHVLHLPMGFFAQRSAGDIASRHSLNEGIASSIIEKLAPLLLDACMLVFYLFVMLTYSVPLTLIGIAVAFINLFISRYIANKRMNLSRGMLRDGAKLSSATLAAAEMIETIKSSGAEEGFFEKWAGYAASVNTAKVAEVKISQTIGLVPGFVSSLSSITVLVLGVALIIKGQFTVGSLLAFQGFMGSFMSPVGKFLGVSQAAIEMKTSMERIEDVMSYKPDVELSAYEGKCSHKLTGHIELRDISFQYGRLSEPVIKNFSLTITPGKSVAIVGASGSGKSTLSKLISGLYPVSSGEITYDNLHKNEISKEVFAASLAVADQDIVLFENTIADNIRMWNNSISDSDMRKAAVDAGIHEAVLHRDGGYKHLVRENGKNFSGGERQRFEIARMLAANPSIIILDEATSALDAKTEHEVMAAIKARNITCIIIAHRLSTIRDCDEIIVLKKGVAVERGRHEQLIEQQGLYASLVTGE